MRLNRILVGLAALGLVTAPTALHATPYASSVTKTGTTVSFVLNEPADTLTYKINGGAAIPLDGATKGTKTFNLGAATDTFSISAEKNAAVGFAIPTGGKTPIPAPAQPGPPAVPAVEPLGLRIQQNLGGYSLISDETSVFARFNSPRGVGVSTNPNAPNFGTAFVADSAPTLTVGAFAPRDMTAGDGIYALRADGADAFAQGNVAANPLFGGAPTFRQDSPSTNSPFRLTVAPTGEVYVADFADNNSNLWVLSPNLSSSQPALTGFDGGGTLPAGGNHGSILASHTTGSIATGDLVIWTMDEDMDPEYVNGGMVAGSARTATFGVVGDPNAVPPILPIAPTQKQTIWKYNVGSGPLPIAGNVVPTEVKSSIIGGAYIATADFTYGADGKLYTSQNRSAGSEAGVYVKSNDGATILWNSLSATRTFLNDPTALDILTNVTGGLAVSPDQKWIATVINRSDVVTMPLVNGLPDISKLLVVDTTTTDTENQGRDISFDAAGNIHYVSSGQSRYRVLAPGGHTLTTLSFDGTSYAFSSDTIAPPATENANFDGVGTVDGNDLLTWQAGFGLGVAPDTTVATKAQGDANGDHKVDAADLVIWNAQFGTTPADLAIGTTVPEPATWASAIVAAMIGLCMLRPRRRLAPARCGAQS